MAVALRAVASVAAAGTSLSCSKPTGTLGGDLLLAFQAADAGVFADMTTPTGGSTWTLLGQQVWNGGDPGTKVWWKIAGGSEPSSYGFAQGSGADGVVVVAAVEGAASTTPVFASSNGAGSTTIPTPSVTPDGVSDLELRWACSKSVGGGLVSYTPPATYTEQADLQSGTFTSGALASKLLSGGGATGVQNFTISTSSPDFVGFTVAVTSGAFLAPRPLMLGQAVQRASYW